MTTPIIGVSTYRKPFRGPDSRSHTWIPSVYAASFEAAGAAVVLLPPQPTAAAEAIVARLDGIVVAGGEDVDPARYDQARHPATQPSSPDRDDWEAALIDAAIADGVPLLGICRGIQLLNVHFGGTLVQHLPDRVDPADYHGGGETFVDNDVDVAAGRIADLVGAGRHRVRTSHHQSVDAVAPGFRVTARSADGAVVEAIEREGDAWVAAVQWHPEEAPDDGIFAGFVALAAARRA